MLTKWAKVGLHNDGEGVIDTNMNHNHLKVIALALWKTKKKPDEEAELIARIANDPSWEEYNFRERWEDVKVEPYNIPNN